MLPDRCSSWECKAQGRARVIIRGVERMCGPIISACPGSWDTAGGFVARRLTRLSGYTPLRSCTHVTSLTRTKNKTRTDPHNLPRPDASESSVPSSRQQSHQHNHSRRRPKYTVAGMRPQHSRGHGVGALTPVAKARTVRCHPPPSLSPPRSPPRSHARLHSILRWSPPEPG